MDGASGSLELQDFRVASRTIKSCCTDRQYERNRDLSHIVHALLHLSQFASVLTIELFHHIHQFINDKLSQQNPKDIPKLHEERHLIYFAIPVSMTVSLLLAIMWFFMKKFRKKLTLSILGTGFGSSMMLLSAISVMRQPELFINLEDWSDDDLLRHPVFIHNFVMCILAIFALALFLTHFWILYEIWRSKRRHKIVQDLSVKSSIDSNSIEYNETSDDATDNTSRRISEKHEDSNDVSTVMTLDDRQRSAIGHDEDDIENQSVILYCFCIDCYNWMRRKFEKSGPDECTVNRICDDR